MRPAGMNLSLLELGGGAGAGLPGEQDRCDSPRAATPNHSYWDTRQRRQKDRTHLIQA